MTYYDLNMNNKTIVNCTSLDISGTYYSNSVSAIQIPADTSDNRPSTGVAGYIRYNTDTNLIEYWNNGTNAWSPVSEPSPSISTISPQYVLQDVSSTIYTITGANFNVFSSVSFIGTDGITYPTASTTYVTGSQLTTLITDAIADASTNTYAVRVTNTNTNFSATTAFIVTFNKGPFWNTVVGSSLGIGIAGVTYTTGTSPFTDLSASEFAPVHLPITYYYSTAPSTVTGSVLLDASLGRLYGTMPSFVGTSSTLYPFTAYPQDASGARGLTESFNFTVQSALLTVTGYTLNTNYTITYVDSSNNLSGSPSFTSYTIYRFTGTGINGTVTPNFDASINYLVAGGGGGGGSGNSGWFGAGGGAGGYRAGEFRFVRNTSYDVIVGAGGTFTASNNASGTNGGSSRLGVVGASGITSSGGGGGPGISSSSSNSGGSGSGGVYSGSLTSGSAGGSGNSGGYIPIEGFAGGGYNFGGQGAPGGSALEKGNETTSDGPLGAINNITGVDVSYCSGGWGNPVSGPSLNNGTGNGGKGGRITSGASQFGTNGSSGVVIVRFPSLITYNPSFKGGRVTGFYPGQYTVTYVTSANSITSAPVSGGFTIYTFLATTTGTFVPNFTDSSVDFLVIGGGGAGGSGGGDQVGAGGGGAGGYRTSYSTSGGSPGTPESKLSLTIGASYTVTVGAGGDGATGGSTGSPQAGANGSNSTFSTITSVGGGGGGGTGGSPTSGNTGGSGGGANPYAGSAGFGTAVQGFAGFKTNTTSFSGGGGGGGASGIGGNSSGPTLLSIGGAGGTGLTSAITGISVARGGGGGGGAYSTTSSASGGSATSGGGSGASSSSASNIPGSPGTQNTGGGGGGAAGGGTSQSVINKGGSGGSGIVVIRFSSF
jgi:hypothetical protein